MLIKPIYGGLRTSYDLLMIIFRYISVGRNRWRKVVMRALKRAVEYWPLAINSPASRSRFATFVLALMQRATGPPRVIDPYRPVLAEVWYIRCKGAESPLLTP